ncbi:hypothetical protein FBU59_006899, partial [Linderina macrospora]
MFSSTLRTPSTLLARTVLARQYSSSAPTIGFIGLGQMGYNMATHLCTKSKSPFVVFDMNKDTVGKFQDENANATAASSPADLADKASVIVTVLPESAHVRSVYLGENGVRDGLRKDTLCIDSSTIDTSVSIDVSKQLIGMGARAVDAPISGGIMGAKAGTLTFMVGSQSSQDYEAAKVYLERMGKNVV